MAAVTYHLLIKEHDEIDSAAEALITSAGKPSVTSVFLADRLDRLATLVADHIAKEDDFVSHLDQNHLAGAWIADWKKGVQEFDMLCNDWLAFLSKWNVTSISLHRNEFHADVRNILQMLRQRVRGETATLYAAALQSGAIRLR